MLKRAGEKRFAEVLADLADLRGVGAVCLQIVDETLVGAGVAAGRDEDRGAPVDVGEQADVVLAAPEARLVNAQAPHPRQILALAGLIDVVMHDAPQPGVVLADQRTDRGDRHLLGERHHERLEQQRKPAARPRPRDRDLMHAVLGAAHPRNPGGQVRLVLKEVQVPPRLGLARVPQLEGTRR